MEMAVPHLPGVDKVTTERGRRPAVGGGMVHSACVHVCLGTGHITERVWEQGVQLRK